MIIKSTCSGSRTIALNEAEFFQPDNFKELSPESFQKLKNSIIKHGITFPVYCWKNKNVLVDGHHRTRALRELEKEGYKIDPLPVIDVEAKNEKELAEKLLLLNSKYARITEEGFYNFLETFDLTMDEIGFEIDIPELDLQIEEEVDDIDFDNIESNEDREKKFKEQTVTCPECNNNFKIQV